MINLKNDKSLLDIKKLAITKHLNFCWDQEFLHRQFH